MKKILFYALFVLITALSFLFSPEPENNNGPGKYCPVDYIQLNNSMGFSMNCDAIEFMGLSINPSLIFEKNNLRQSRPLYILSGSLTGYSIYYLTTPFHEVINNIASEQFQSQIPKEKVSLYLSHYAGLVLVNLIILVFALFFFEKIIFYCTGPWQNGIGLRLGLLLMLISNYVTKTFFWTPHQQMFNTLIPLVCVWLFILVLKNQYPTRSLFFISLVCGMLMLFYGSFLLLLPILIISIFYKRKIELKYKLMKIFKPALLASIAFSLPIITWVFILKICGVGFYSHEAGFFREFIWMSDAFKSKDRSLMFELINNLSAFIKTCAIIIIPVIFLIIAYTFSYKNTDSGKLAKSQCFNFIFIIVALLIFIFFWLMGYYADRLTYTLNPVIVCYAAILLNRRPLNRIKTISIVSMILLWHIFILLNEMPHFTNRFYY